MMGGEMREGREGSVQREKLDGGRLVSHPLSTHPPTPPLNPPYQLFRPPEVNSSPPTCRNEGAQVYSS